MPNHRGDLCGNARATSHPDPFHLAEPEFLAPAIVELRGARAGMGIELETRELPGGTPAISSSPRNSAASAARSVPRGPQTTRR
ncbi:MAG TPA: hypothetical protein VMB73_04845 [Acetobacteraceae bacterium]|nr:hypothetical protein [Acetobacteraceae bacterium]